jgi:RNA 2',3'-cyclic 3'-phosphodiesterase
VRLFVGVELDDRVREAAAVVAESLKRQLANRVDARWISAANLHITLWFIGEVDDGRGENVLGALDAPFEERAFDIDIDGVGAFPPSGPPRVLWLGVASGGENLRRLHSEVAVRLRPLGFEPERRPYSAHLTIARVKEVSRAISSRALRDMLQTIRGNVGRSRTTHVTVFRSRLSPKGSHYEPLLRIPLQ